MNRLHCVNLIGVLALAALCVAQWQRDRRLNLEINRLERQRFDREAGVAKQEQAMRGLNADLAQFKEQFGKSSSELNDVHQKFRAAERDLLQLTRERDQLKSSITNWASAVATRDERLKEASVQTRRLADELNGSIRRFNELASNHNGIVKDLNELRARASQPKSASQ
jgi:chromosome segregation ATPase